MKIKEAAVLVDGLIYSGKRHSDVYRNMLSKGIRIKKDNNVQGFITDEGKFVSRQEALKIATESGQVEKKLSSNGILFSEDLEGRK